MEETFWNTLLDQAKVFAYQIDIYSISKLNFSSIKKILVLKKDSWDGNILINKHVDIMIT